MPHSTDAHLLNQERLSFRLSFLTEQLDLDWRAITATTAILALVVVLARAFLGVTVAMIILLVLDDRRRARPHVHEAPHKVNSNWTRTGLACGQISFPGWDPWMHLYGARSHEQR